MKYSVYKLLIPEFIRNRIYLTNIRQYEFAEQRRRSSIEKTARRVELSSVYIKNLRILVNRDALFNSLPKKVVGGLIGLGQNDVLFRLLQICQPHRLYLLNQWQNEENEALNILRRQYHHELKSERLIIKYGKPSAEIKEINDGCLNWVYIQSDGSYEATLEVLESCCVKVNSSGIIGGSNYNRGSWIYGTKYGVIEAVHGFCKNNGWEMIYLTHESCRNLSYAIRRIRIDDHGN